MKKRVHEIAKEYNMSNKDFLDLVHELGIDANSHLCGLEDSDIEKIAKHLGKGEDASTEGKKKKKKRSKGAKDSKKETSKEPKEKTSHKKKKGRRSDFIVNKAEEVEEVVIEEDGLKVIKLAGEITLGDFATKLKVSSTELIKKLFLKGQMLTINSTLPMEIAEEIAEEYDAIIEIEEPEELEFGEKFALEIEDKEEELQERPPVITIMGHVDHGKTSLLDAIRATNVADGEAGGITQKIGAYQITKNGQKITFVDTPGHEAFTDMRARGAQVTDIAILVVAADDGVMPQTVEALAHAKSANVPIIIAVNKIDKEAADPSRVKNELMEHGIVPVEWGGDVEFVEVSAKQRINLDGLLETILLTSEILELKANPKKRAKGIVLESRLDPKVGPVADVLIQEGELKVGDIIVAGEANGRVRALINDMGSRVEKIGLSQPTEIIGFNAVPGAGDVVYVIQNEQHAKRIVEEMTRERRMATTAKKSITLESLSQTLEDATIKELNIILRADSKGSVEALKDSLNKISTNEVAVNIIQAAAGAITESDVRLAEVSDAIIIGFHVRPTTKALKDADAAGVEIRTSSIIYHITEDIEKALTGMLEPEFKEIYLGRIEIKKVFNITGFGKVAGCFVVDGKVKNDSNIRLLRNGVVVYEGALSTLKRYKDDAKEVVAGQECGLGIKNFNDIKEGDIVEAFDVQEIKRTLR